jgi:hypothetical protein
MDMTTIDILDPAGPIQKLAPLQCTAVGSLRGLRLAILDNSKPNFQRLATLIAQKLQAEHSMQGIGYFRKENPAVGAGTELLDRIAQSADLVLTGSAD